jgi:hypothetical protein
MDGGLTWSTLNPGLTPGNFVRDLVADPVDSSRLFLVTASKGVLKSVNQGATWNSASSGLPASKVSTLAISASDSLTLYAGTAVDCDDCEYSGDGVFKSIDGGASWTAISNGLPGGAIFLVAVDPQDSATVYVGQSMADTNALFKSVDGGATWDRLNSGLDGSYAGSLAIDPHNDTAWHVLGRWNRVLADVSSAKRFVAGLIYGQLPKGSYEEAERAMKKAIALNPNRLMHYIELGRIYAQMGRKEEARQFINKGLAMPDTEKDDPETKQRGRETLAKL